jgi:hypothetical protein
MSGFFCRTYKSYPLIIINLTPNKLRNTQLKRKYTSVDFQILKEKYRIPNGFLNKGVKKPINLKLIWSTRYNYILRLKMSTIYTIN